MQSPGSDLDLMRRSSARFYSDAVRIGVHPFIEFTGLMNEWIKAAERAGSVHDGAPVKLESHEKAYIREKLTCIFGEQLWK